MTTQAEDNGRRYKEGQDEVLSMSMSMSMSIHSVGEGEVLRLRESTIVVR